MNKKIRNIAAVAFLTFIGTSAMAQVAQQKVGGNPMTINENAALEVESNNKGLLLPRLALSATNSFAPLTAHVRGMTVYNTASAGTAPNNVTPGYYYNDGTKWVRIVAATDIKTEPWFRQGTTSTQATLNTENIYQTGKVSIGGSNSSGTLTVLNASGAINTTDVAMRALRPNGAWATLNFISNLGGGSFSHLSIAGDKGLIFSTDGDGSSYSRNGLLIAPHTAGASASPFGFKITEQGLSTINAPVPTETFDVNGTFRVRQLPVHGATNAIFTLPDGNSSLPETGAIGDIKKTQTFTATRTVVADSNGVLGYVNGLPQKEQFYAPSIVLPTSPNGISTATTADIYYTATTQTFTVKLHSIYNKQFGMSGDVAGSSRTAIRSNASANLVTYTVAQLDYFVTYFDNTVFDPLSITLDANGVMTYKILPSATVTEKTYMNVVFKVK